MLVYLRFARLVFGATTSAQTTAWSVLMVGLAAGGYGAGRVAFRLKRPLHIYGVIQVLVGLLCGGMPLFFHAITASYVQVAASESGSFFWLTYSRIVRAGLVMFVPAFLLGASLPLLARHWIPKRSLATKQYSRIVAGHMLGAAVGGLGATYWLLPNFGVISTLYTAVGIQLGVSLFIIGLQVFWSRAKVPVLARMDATPVNEPFCRPLVLADVWIWLVAWLAGFFLFSLGVLWTHLVQLTVGGSADVVGAIMTSLVLGLGLGMRLSPFLLAWVPDARHVLITISSLTALVFALHMPVWNHLPDFFRLVSYLNHGFLGLEGVRFAVVVLVLLPPMLCLGLLFPVLVGLAIRDVRQAGRMIGSLSAITLLGGVVGVLVADFFLLPKVGSEWSLQLHTMIYALLPIPLWRSLRAHLTERQLAWRIVAVPFVVAILLLLTSWDLRSLARGANGTVPQGRRSEEQILYFNEGVQGGVTMVLGKGKVTTLLSNGRVVGATGAASFFPTQMALVPMIHLPRMDTALNIGLGTGQTLATMAVGRFSHIDVAEAVPEIVEVARRFFLANPPRVLDDPRIAIAQADGRNFLLLHPTRRYDLITVYGRPIGLAGASTLYSREFYDLCRTRLSPGGILQQWLDLHHLRWEDQLAVLATLGASFPYVALWTFGHKAILLGSNEPLLADYQTVIDLAPAFRAAGVLDGFATPDLFSVFAYYRLDNTAVRAFLRDAIPPNRWNDYIATDLHPIWEYGFSGGSNDADPATRFQRKTAPYSYLPLGSILINIPPHEVPALIRLIEIERTHSVSPTSIAAQSPAVLRTP
jgi:spermidine synthase